MKGTARLAAASSVDEGAAEGSTEAWASARRGTARGICSAALRGWPGRRHDAVPVAAGRCWPSRAGDPAWATGVCAGRRSPVPGLDPFFIKTRIYVSSGPGLDPFFICTNSCRFCYFIRLVKGLFDKMKGLLNVDTCMPSTIMIIPLISQVVYHCVLSNIYLF